MKTYLFSYGTLQKEKVQIETFGRILNGESDSLPGYKLSSIEIFDELVLYKSQQMYHPIAVISGNPDDIVQGWVFEVTFDELLLSDQYEVGEYTRITVKLSSGKNAWVYIG